MENQQERVEARRGFAAMSPERQREIARQGGRAAHQQCVVHEWSREEEREADKKGGQASCQKRNGGGNNGASLLYVNGDDIMQYRKPLFEGFFSVCSVRAHS